MKINKNWSMLEKLAPDPTGSATLLKTISVRVPGVPIWNQETTAAAAAILVKLNEPYYIPICHCHTEIG